MQLKNNFSFFSSHLFQNHNASRFCVLETNDREKLIFIFLHDSRDVDDVYSTVSAAVAFEVGRGGEKKDEIQMQK